MGVLPAASRRAESSQRTTRRVRRQSRLRAYVSGTTLYMPVFHKGGLFYTGDAHAAQGDGEISGTAIETANTAIFQFILHKGKTLGAARAETPTHYIAIGLDPVSTTRCRWPIDGLVEP